MRRSQIDEEYKEYIDLNLHAKIIGSEGIEVINVSLSQSPIKWPASYRRSQHHLPNLFFSISQDSSLAVVCTKRERERNNDINKCWFPIIYSLYGWTIQWIYRQCEREREREKNSSNDPINSEILVLWIELTRAKWSNKNKFCAANNNNNNLYGNANKFFTFRLLDKRCKISQDVCDKTLRWRRKKNLFFSLPLILSHHQFNAIYGRSSIQSRAPSKQLRERTWMVKSYGHESSQFPLHPRLSQYNNNIQCTLCSTANILSPAVLFWQSLERYCFPFSIYHFGWLFVAPIIKIYIGYCSVIKCHKAK